MRTETESGATRATVVCPVCGRTVTSRQSGNTTKCPAARGGCGAPIYIPTGTTRSSVPLDCRECGHTWTSRAKSGSVIRCPSCSHPRRIPSGARTPGAPPPRRPVRNPRPRPSRPDTPPRPPAVPASDGPSGPSWADVLRTFTEAVTSQQRARAATPAPVPRPSAPAPLAAPRRGTTVAPFPSRSPVRDRDRPRPWGGLLCVACTVAPAWPAEHRTFGETVYPADPTHRTAVLLCHEHAVEAAHQARRNRDATFRAVPMT